MNFISNYREYFPHITALIVGVSLPRREPFKPLLDGGWLEVGEVWFLCFAFYFILMWLVLFIHHYIGASSARDDEIGWRQISDVVCITVIILSFFMWLFGGVIPRVF